MLLTCLKTGLTVGGSVYKEGMLFKCTPFLERKYGEVSDVEMAKEQRKMYGEILFRRPTSNELYLAVKKEKKFKFEDLDKKQRKAIAIEMIAQKEKDIQELEVFKESVDEPAEEEVKVKEEAPKEESEETKEEVSKKPAKKKKRITKKTK